MQNTTLQVMANRTLIPSSCKRPEPFTPVEQWTQIVVLVLIILVSLIGNSLVIIIVKRMKRLKNPTGFLIANLSVCEILATLVILTNSLAMKIHPGRYPYLSDAFALIFCKTLLFLDAFCHDVAILSFTAIAVDRFLGVQFALKRIINCGRAKIIIAAIWILAFIATCINLYSSRHKNIKGNLACYYSWAPFAENSGMIFIITQMVLFYIIPLCIMGVLYSITVRMLWVRRIPGNVTAANQRLEYQTKMNVLKMCITVVVAFALCWLPLYVTRAVQLSKILQCPLSRTLVTAMLYMSFTYYAINPLIYFIFSRDFRKGFYSIISPLLKFCSTFQGGGGREEGGGESEVPTTQLLVTDSA